MSLDILSDLLLFPTAVLVWRWSRLMSCALQLALLAAVAVRLGIEEARMVSALTGLAGAVEIYRVLENPRELDADSRCVLVGAILLASMASDGASWILYRLTWTWTLPSVQIPALVWIGMVSLKGESR